MLRIDTRIRITLILYSIYHRLSLMGMETLEYQVCQDDSSMKCDGKKKRDSFSVETKFAVIKEVENGTKYKEIVEKYSLKSSSNISTFLRHKDKIVDAFHNKANPNRKRLRKSDYPEVEECLLRWIDDMKAQNEIDITGPVILKQAASIASNLGYHEFKASTGWLERFRERSGMKRSSRSKKAEPEDCLPVISYSDDWISNKLPQLVLGYSESNIYVFKEFELFYCIQSDKSNCRGKKQLEEKVDVGVCCNMNGSDKRKLLVIGKAQGSPSLQGIKRLPVLYKSSKTGRLTLDIFESFIADLNKQVCSENRNILMFVDNSSPHNFENEYCNVKLVAFPFGKSSMYSPMDFGIIRSLKLAFKKRMMLEDKTDKCSKQVSLLDAMYMLYGAWIEVDSLAVINSFKSSGFKPNDVNNYQPQSNYTSDGAEVLNIIIDPYSVTCVPPYDVNSGTTSIPSSSQNSGNVFTQQNQSIEENKIDEETKSPSETEARKCLNTLRRYFERCDDTDDIIFASLDQVDKALQDQLLKKIMTNYFTKKM